MGEKSCAYIIADTPLKAVMLRRHLREQGIEDFKLPDRFIQIDNLPLTAVGKVDKNACASALKRNNRLREMNR